MSKLEFIPNFNQIPNAETIRFVAKRIYAFVHRTPVLTCHSINAKLKAELFFKCENFQKVGAFKARGACNAVLDLSDEEAAKGVATHSSGNHAQALALAAKNRGIPAYIVMPSNAPKVKVAAVKGYGAEIIFCEPTLEARESNLEAVVAKAGATFVHPYNDYRIIAGQATAALELIEDYPDLDYILTPVGGGGLLSGTALSTKYFSPNTTVIGTEPKGADDAFRSFQKGELIPSQDPNTIADGLLTSLGEKTFEILRKEVQDIVVTKEENIIAAMKLIWERMKIIIEPSSAVPLAAMLEGKLPQLQGKKVGIILSGGNVDLGNLPW